MIVHLRLRTHVQSRLACSLQVLNMIDAFGSTLPDLEPYGQNLRLRQHEQEVCKCGFCLPSRKLTWKPKKGPIKTTVPLNRGYTGFHVSLGECISCHQGSPLPALVQKHAPATRVTSRAAKALLWAPDFRASGPKVNPKAAGLRAGYQAGASLDCKDHHPPL